MLGPILSIVMNNRVLIFPVHKEATAIGLVRNLGMVVVAKQLYDDGSVCK